MRHIMSRLGAVPQNGAVAEFLDTAHCQYTDLYNSLRIRRVLGPSVWARSARATLETLPVDTTNKRRYRVMHRP